MMKKYLITEEQLNRALTSKVTKGIGLKIQDGDGEYYKSIIKTFDTDDDLKRWENNLDEGTTVIGMIDIEEPQTETLQESTGDVKKKDMGIRMLERLMKKKYPYITDLEVDTIMDQFINISIHFDLNKFYDLTRTRTSQRHIENEWWDLLKEKGPYLMRYVDESFRNKVNEIRENIEKDLNRIYRVLPKNVVHTKYEDWDDDYISRLDNGHYFYTEWRDSKEPMNIYIENFIPQLNVDNLLLTFSQGD